MDEMYLKKLHDIIDYAIESDYSTFYKQMETLEKMKNANHICVFGTGIFFREGYPYIKQRIKAEYVCDNSFDDNNVHKTSKDYYGLTCITVNELQKLKDVCVVIMIGDYKEVKQQLDAIGITSVYVGDTILNMHTKKHDAQWFKKEKSSIIKAMELFEDDLSRQLYVNLLCNRIAPHLSNKTFRDLQSDGEYFNKEFFKFTMDEVFVDVGAYTGDTIEEFITVTNNSYGNIYAFELQKSNFEIMKKNIGTYPNIELFNQGISDGESEPEIFTSLDVALCNKRITFIKMDIEGYELQALCGSKEIIRKQEPKLAICVYHKLEDLWHIPHYIKTIHPKYKLFIRHHAPVAWDSVLYGIC